MNQSFSHAKSLPVPAPTKPFAALLAELRAWPASAWQSVPDCTALNYVPLITVGGLNNTAFVSAGAVAITEWLQACPQLQQILSQLRQPLSRSYLLALPPQQQLALPTTYHYHHWQRHTAYLPLDSLRIQRGDKTVCLTAGEVYRLPSLMSHQLYNDSEQTLYIVVATSLATAPMLGVNSPLKLEPYQFEIFRPAEIRQLCQPIIQALATQPEQQATIDALTQFQARWQTLFNQFARQAQGELWYRDLLLTLIAQLAPLFASSKVSNKPAQQHFDILTSALQQPLLSADINHLALARQRRQRSVSTQLDSLPQFDRPTFIVSAPRAGSTLLFDLLAHYPAVWTIAEESHATIEGIDGLHPADHGFNSNVLTAADATAERVKKLTHRFTMRLQDRAGQHYLALASEQRPHSLRFLEKTPKNALRIPFLAAAFPDARFIFLYRSPKENVSSLIEGWYSRRFLAYKTLPDWPHQEWSFLLPPGWRNYANAPIAEIAAYQWYRTNQMILDSLATLEPSQWCQVNYDDLISNPETTLYRLGAFAELTTDAELHNYLQQPPRPSRMTLSPPDPNKWKRYQADIAPYLPELQSLWSVLEPDKSC